MKISTKKRTRKSFQCWIQNENGTEKSNCSSKASGCYTSWQTQENTIKKIQTQGCFNGNAKHLNCSTGSCSSIKLNPISDVSSQNTKNASRSHFCCCTQNFCNSRDNLEWSLSSSTNSLNSTPDWNHPNLIETTHLSTASLSNMGCSSFPILLLAYSVTVTIILGIIIAEVIRKKLFGDCNVNHRLMKKRFKKQVRKQKNVSSKEKSQRLLSFSSSENSDKSSQRTWFEESTETFDLFVDFDNLMKSGNCGKVFFATDKITMSEYCFKVPQANGNSFFTNETSILQMLSHTEHTNVVKYYGIYSVRNTIGFIMEHCSMGSLRNYLDRTTINDMKLCLMMLNDLASGIAYLHSYDITEPYKLPVAHRDICSGNILLRENLRLVVADFGVAAILDEFSAENTENITKTVYAEGTPFYMAPELLNCSIDLTNVSSSLKQADVYSMALVMWEIVSQCNVFFNDADGKPPKHLLPYQEEVTSTQELTDYVAVQDHRPKFPFSFSRLSDKKAVVENFQTNEVEIIKMNLIRTIEECWDKDEDARLAASCVSRRLTLLSRDFKRPAIHLSIPKV